MCFAKQILSASHNKDSITTIMIIIVVLIILLIVIKGGLSLKAKWYA